LSDHPDPDGLARSVKRLFDQFDAPTDDSGPPSIGADGGEAPTRLAQAVSDYLLAPGSERGPLADAVRSEAAAARSAGDLDDLAAAVEELLVQPVPDPDATALACEIVDPAVETRLALRMGAVRDEGRRSALVEAIVPLGGSMAEAIGEALTDTEDSLARRTYVAALVALGEAARDVVERMLDDSRWWVVRNAVHVLGERASADAIGLLTAPLAHEHAQVRLATVRALARIGGEDAGMLLLGMLGDPEAPVRASAARALGEIRLERALRPLLERLEEEEDEDALEAVIGALGRLGDPSAVQAIEKRGLEGSFFSKPKKDVRIAAYGALAAIGTPRAMGLVEAAASDRDPEVAAAVRRILAEREEARQAAASDVEGGGADDA